MLTLLFLWDKCNNFAANYHNYQEEQYLVLVIWRKKEKKYQDNVVENILCLQYPTTLAAAEVNMDYTKVREKSA